MPAPCEPNLAKGAENRTGLGMEEVHLPIQVQLMLMSSQVCGAQEHLEGKTDGFSQFPRYELCVAELLHICQHGNISIKAQWTD